MAMTPTQVLAAIALSDPDRIAIDSGGENGTVTYAELDHDVDRLAGWIADRTGEGRVAIGVRARQPRQIATAFQAIARSGHIAVPIDPSSPVDRAGVMIADVEAPIVLTDEPSFLAGLPVHVVGVDDAVAAGRPFGAAVELVADDITAIIFTSGSTGTPKGTITTHGRTTNMLERCRAAGLGPGQRRYGLPMTGSISNSEVMLAFALADGATVVYYDIKTLGVQPLARWLRDKEVQSFATVPTMLRLMIDTMGADEKWPALETVTTWGEGITWHDVERLRNHLEPTAELVVTYGATEAGAVAFYLVTSETPLGDGRVPAGKPMPGLKIRVVNEDGVEVAPGESGEIVVEGDIGAGYWKRPDLTEAVFRTLGDGSKACWTRDRGRWLPDGNLEHLGRVDHMVKISGNRVDLGEIEVALRSLSEVADAGVVTREDAAGDVRLVAFVSAIKDRSVDSASLRAQLARKVPGYMLPDVFVTLDELPRLPNGKLDRKSLPDVQAGQQVARSSTQRIGPRNDLEEGLYKIWSSVLGTRDIGVYDRFVDLGGDSIRAARMFALVERQLGYDRPVSLLIEAPTIAEIAASLRSSVNDVTWHALVPVKTNGSRPPLFVVHGGGGDVMFVGNIAKHMDDDQPVYGLRPSVLRGGRLTERSVPELAESYVSAIRNLWPNGPYQLYGYSFGGVVAFEMACQLEAAGAVVTVLCIGDVPAPDFVRTFPPPLAGQVKQRIAATRSQSTNPLLVELAGRVALRVRNLTRQGYRITRERIAYARIERYLQHGRTVPPSLRNDLSMKEFKAVGAGYRPRQAFSGGALLVRSAEMSSGVARGPIDYGWGTHVLGGVRSIDVPGTHDDLAREHVHAVARALQDEIDAAAIATSSR